MSQGTRLALHLSDKLVYVCRLIECGAALNTGMIPTVHSSECKSSTDGILYDIRYGLAIILLKNRKVSKLYVYNAGNKSGYLSYQLHNYSEVFQIPTP